MRNTPLPTAYGEFLIEQAFWQTLGVSVSDLEEWPTDRVDLYVRMMAEQARWREIQAEIAAAKARARSSGGR